MVDGEVVGVSGAGPAVEVLAVEQDLLMMAEKRVGLMKRLVGLALSVTSKNDWVDQDGEPYLCASGAEKVGRLFGVRIQKVKVTKEPLEAGGYQYTAQGEFSLKDGESVEAIGVCNTRHKLFCKRKEGWLPIAEIDEANIKRAAYTNMENNGICRLLGIRGLSWGDLAKCGFDRKEIAAVGYSKGAQGGETRNAGEKAEATKTENQIREELTSAIVELNGIDGGDFMGTLERLSAFKGSDGKDVAGIRLIGKLSGKRLEVTLGKARKALEGAKKEAAPAGAA